ncbi:ATP-binding protein [Streptomyces sp. Ru73]|nr:ATP-binding protein [Streptomyces sp. Ru73]
MGEHLGGTAVSPAEGPLLDRVFESADLARVRHQVADRAARAGLRDPRLGDFVLAVNEVVTHVVLRGGGKGRIRLHHGGIALRCVITHDEVGQAYATPDTDLSDGHGGGHADHGLGLRVARAAVDWFAMVTCGAVTTVTLVAGLD